MLLNLKAKLILSIVLSLLVIPQLSRADITLSDDDAASIVVKLEQANICNSQIENAEKRIELLEKEIELMTKVNELQKEQIELSKQTIEQMKEISKQKDISCEQRVKDAKPSFWSQVTQYGIFTAIGLTLGLLL